MSLEAKLDALHARVRNFPVLQRFTALTRLLLGVGFIAPGLTKLRGNRFTILGTDTPIGFFFEALYQSGLYWRFIGAAQVLAAILTLIPRTATWGAICFFPIILNIFIITISMNFAGTPIITGLMLLANLYLLCWDYHKFKPVFFNSHAPIPAFTDVTPHWIERTGYALVFIASFTLLLATRGIVTRIPAPLLWSLLLAGLAGGWMILTGWVLLLRKSPSSE
jgi:uncharacterized membrane protein YphA (DoxX/SURF4 family)